MGQGRVNTNGVLRKIWQICQPTLDLKFSPKLKTILEDHVFAICSVSSSELHIIDTIGPIDTYKAKDLTNTLLSESKNLAPSIRRPCSNDSQNEIKSSI